MPAKSNPFSIRLSAYVDGLVSEHAKRTRRSKSAVVESLAEEAVKTRAFPGIAFRGTDWDRRAWVIGTSLDAWEMVRALRDFESPSQMAEQTDLAENHINLAVSYYRRFPEEIDEAIALADRPVEDLLAQYPMLSRIQPR